MPSATPVQKRTVWGYGAALCASSLLITGYAIYRANQSIHIPLVLLLKDPSLYPLDPFASTLPSYPSMLWRIVSLFTEIVPIEPLFLSLFILERSLLMYASARLARAYAPDSTLAVIGTMSFFALAPEPFIGAGTIVINYFEQTGLSIPFFMLSVASFYQSRPIATAIWLAIGFNLNSMYGTYALTYLASAFFTGSPNLVAWKKWRLSIMLFILLSLPALLLSLSAFLTGTTDKDLWLIASRLCFPYHLYPLTQGIKNFLIFFVFILLTVAFMRHCKKDLRKLFKFSIGWTVVALGWMVIAFVAAYIAKAPSMLVLHPARGTDLWYCFVGPALISASALKAENSLERKRFYAGMFFIFTLLWHPDYFLLLSPILIGFFWKPAWNRILKGGDSKRLAFVLTLLILLLSGYFLQVRIRRGTALQFKPDESRMEIARWAQETTGVRSSFLVSPFWSEFRGVARRSVFVTVRDGNAILWNRSFVHEWSKRFFALGYDIRKAQNNSGLMYRDLTRLYEALNDQQIQKIKSEFLIHYWIVPVEHVSSFPIVFQNEQFKVLDLK